MDEFSAIVDNVPVIVRYFVPGFVLIRAYCFVRCIRPDKITGGVFLQSAVISAIMIGAFGMFQCIAGLEANAQILVYAAIATVLGYVFAKAASSVWFNTFIYNLGIHRTTEQNIWNDAFSESGQWICIYEKERDIRYRGWLTFFEDNERDPLLILSRYCVEESDGTVIYDADETGETLVLRASDARRIEVVPHS